MDKHNLHGKSLKYGAKRADKRCCKGYIAVDHRCRSQARVHLNDLDIEPFGFKESFGLGHIERHRRTAPASIGDADSLRRIGAPYFIACTGEISRTKKQAQTITRSLSCI